MKKHFASRPETHSNCCKQIENDFHICIGTWWNPAGGTQQGASQLSHPCLSTVFVSEFLHLFPQSSSSDYTDYLELVLSRAMVLNLPDATTP